MARLRMQCRERWLISVTLLYECTLLQEGSHNGDADGIAAIRCRGEADAAAEEAAAGDADDPM